MTPNHFEARLHLLLFDEILPNITNVTEAGHPFGLWNPYPYPPNILEMLRAVSQGLYPVQRTLLKVALQMLIDPEEAILLQSLRSEGRLRMDPNPKLLLFCLGRRSGKTVMLTRLARLLGALGGVAVCAFNESQASDLRRDCNAEVFPINNIRSRQDRSFETQMFDEVMPDEIALNNTQRSSRSIGFYTYDYMSGPLIVPDSIPTLALNLDTRTINPELVNSRFIDVRIRENARSRDEFYPPPVDHTIIHNFIS